MVQQQPTAPTTTVLRPVGDNYLTLSIVLTILCCVCTGLSSLICTLPAVFFAKQVYGVHNCIFWHIMMKIHIIFDMITILLLFSLSIIQLMLIARHAYTSCFRFYYCDRHTGWLWATCSLAQHDWTIILTYQFFHGGRLLCWCI